MANRKINNRGFIGLLVLLVAMAIIAVISYKALIQPGDNPVGLGEAKKQIDRAKEVAGLAEERAKQIEGQIKEAGEVLSKNEIEATLKITSGEEQKSYFRTLEKGSSAVDMMKKVGEEEKDFNFEFKDSDLGAFIEKINGVANDANAKVYWMFYVNGELSQIGASQYKLADGDIIEWKYEDMSNDF